MIKCLRCVEAFGTCWKIVGNADVLKDLHPLVDENISISKHDFSKWAEQSLTYHVFTIVNSLLHYYLFSQRKSKKKDNSLRLAESCLHPNAAQYSIVRVFAACKSNINANKNVTAHLNHVKNTCDMHSIHHSRVGG